MRPHDDLEVEAALKRLFETEMVGLSPPAFSPLRGRGRHSLTWPALGLAALLVVGLVIVRPTLNPAGAVSGGPFGATLESSSHQPASVGMTFGASAPPTGPTPEPSAPATASPSIGPSIGPLVDGIPTSIGDQAVLQMPAAVKDLVASGSDTSFLVGGWFHIPAPVWWCPAQGYDAPWGTCLRFALYEAPTGGISDVLGTPVWLYGQPPTETILIFPGSSLTLDETPPYAATRPVVIALHTHDPACAVGQVILGEPCSSQVVLDAVVWAGPPVK